MSNLEITINIPDKDIKKLENAKHLLKDIVQILQEIREINNNFSLTNVIEADENTILVFKYDNVLIKQEDLNRHEAMLSEKLGYKCILLIHFFSVV